MKLCMLCLVFDRQVVARNMYVLFTVFWVHLELLKL